MDRRENLLRRNLCRFRPSPLQDSLKANKRVYEYGDNTLFQLISFIDRLEQHQQILELQCR